MLIIYSKPNCTYCNQAKMFMTARKFEFEERNVEENDAWMKEFEAFEPKTFPVITNGKSHTEGFKPNEINELYNSK